VYAFWQATELECRLSSSSSQLSSSLEAHRQLLERYREAKADSTALAQQLEQVGALQGVLGTGTGGP
jgi:hypothetical protein